MTTVVESPRPVEPCPEPVESARTTWSKLPVDTLARIDAKLEAHSAAPRPFSWLAQTSNPPEPGRPVDDAPTAPKRDGNRPAPASSSSPNNAREDVPILLERFRNPSWTDHRDFLQIASAVFLGGFTGSAIGWSLASTWIL